MPLWTLDPSFSIQMFIIYEEHGIILFVPHPGHVIIPLPRLHLVKLLTKLTLYTGILSLCGHHRSPTFGYHCPQLVKLPFDVWLQCIALHTAAIALLFQLPGLCSSTPTLVMAHGIYIQSQQNFSLKKMLTQTCQRCINHQPPCSLSFLTTSQKSHVVSTLKPSIALLFHKTTHSLYSMQSPHPHIRVCLQHRL